MRYSPQAASWVVYRMNIRGKLCGTNAVCPQSEWDAMELERPGFHQLIRGGIANEGEAERLARSTPVVEPPMAAATVEPAGKRLMNRDASAKHKQD